MKPTLIVTRPEPSGAEFAAAVAARLGGVVPTIVAPLMRIVPLPVQIDVPRNSDFVFTSVNGVMQADRIGFAAGQVAWCVGERTAMAAHRIGFKPRVGPGDGAGLRDLILSEQPKAPLVHIRGRHTRGHIAQELAAAGVQCVDVIAYDQEAVAPTQEFIDALAGRKPLIVPLFSPRSATILAKAARISAPIHVVAISEAVAAEASVLGAETVTVAARACGDAMVDATVERFGALYEGV